MMVMMIYGLPTLNLFPHRLFTYAEVHVVLAYGHLDVLIMIVQIIFLAL